MGGEFFQKHPKNGMQVTRHLRRALDTTGAQRFAIRCNAFFVCSLRKPYDLCDDSVKMFRNTFHY